MYRYMLPERKPVQLLLTAEQKVKVKVRVKEWYIAPFILDIVSKRSDMDHTVLPANYNMPAFLS